MRVRAIPRVVAAPRHSPAVPLRLPGALVGAAGGLGLRGTDQAELGGCPPWRAQRTSPGRWCEGRRGGHVTHRGWRSQSAVSASASQAGSWDTGDVPRWGLGRGPEPSNGQLRSAEPLTDGVTGVLTPASGEDASQQRSQLGTPGERPRAHPTILFRPGYLAGPLAGASKVCCCITKQSQTPQPKTIMSRFARVRIQEWPAGQFRAGTPLRLLAEALVT